MHYFMPRFCHFMKETQFYISIYNIKTNEADNNVSFKDKFYNSDVAIIDLSVQVRVLRERGERVNYFF